MPERCAPTTHSSISPAAAVRGAARPPPARGIVAPPIGTPAAACSRRAERREQPVVAPRARSASPRPGSRRRGRGRARRARTEVEQVDEVGVGAELAVRPDRVGREIRPAYAAADRSARCSTSTRVQIALGRRAAGRPADRGRREGIRRGEPSRAVDDPAGSPDASLSGRALDEGADRGVALGDPAALVEQVAPSRTWARDRPRRAPRPMQAPSRAARASKAASDSGIAAKTRPAPHRACRCAGPAAAARRRTTGSDRENGSAAS